VIVPFDQLVALDRLVDLVPDLELVGLLLGELDLAVLVLGLLEVDVDGVADLDRGCCRRVDELFDGDLAFGLVADVYGHVVLGDLDHDALDDLAFLGAVSGLVFLKELLEL
jgi:hypothetical protein